MALYKNLDIDVDESREFLLIGRSLQELNPEVRESRFAGVVSKSLICEALDYVWGLARKRGNILDVYGNDLVVRCYRWELDRFAEGMASAFAAAFNWFRWDGDGELVLVNWLCRNSLDQSEAEQRRIATEERIKLSSVERKQRRWRKEKKPEKTVRTPAESVRTLSDFAGYEVSGHCPDTCPDTPQPVQEHVHVQEQEQELIPVLVCSEENLTNPVVPVPCGGGDEKNKIFEVLAKVPLDDLFTRSRSVCSPEEFREAIGNLFESFPGTSEWACRSPRGPEAYLRKRYEECKRFSRSSIESAILSEKNDGPEDSKIPERWASIFERARVEESKRIQKEIDRKHVEKRKAEEERERIARDEAARDEADFQALCELLAEGTESDIESAVAERWPMDAAHSAGERRVVNDSRGRYRKRILERIQTIRKEKEVPV